MYVKNEQCQKVPDPAGCDTSRSEIVGLPHDHMTFQLEDSGLHLHRLRENILNLTLLRIVDIMVKILRKNLTFKRVEISFIVPQRGK